MSTETETEQKESAPDRWTLIRDIAVFQFKLFVDGFRDLLLVPISLVTGLISLFSGGQKPGTEFYDLLRYGRQSERWINLFGAADHMHGPEHNDPNISADDMDQIVAKVESYIVEEYHKGGITAKAKHHLDDALNSMSKLGRRGRGKDEAASESAGASDPQG